MTNVLWFGYLILWLNTHNMKMQNTDHQAQANQNPMHIASPAHTYDILDYLAHSLSSHQR